MIPEVHIVMEGDLDHAHVKAVFAHLPDAERYSTRGDRWVETWNVTEAAAMTVSDERPEMWKVIPGFSSYEASDRGQVRSVDRVLAGGRRCKSQLIAQRLSTRGYPQVNLNDDDGIRRTREVHALIMAAFEGPCPPGRQVRHWNDIPTDNRWAPGGEEGCRRGEGNLVYGTPKQQWDDKLRNVPAPLAKRRYWSRRVTDYVRSPRRRVSR
jgi:hypothetical protein